MLLAHQLAVESDFITGDMVDRGPDALGLVRRLVSLREQAPTGKLVVQADSTPPTPPPVS